MMGYARVLMLAGGPVVIALATTSSRGQPPLRDTEAVADEGAKESVRVRYARAYLKLAKMDLRRAMDANRKFARMHSAGLVERLRQNVKIAEEQLRQVLKGDAGKLHEVHLRQTEAAVKIAELELQQAVVLSKRAPAAVRRGELERLRVAAEIARLDLMQAREPASFQSAMPHLQWQLEQLRKEVLRLQLRVERLSVKD
ncbi:MAG: hypothetical protein ACC645_05015 [Pirellulales bacterium]